MEIGILQAEISEHALMRLQLAVEDNDIITHPEGDVASLAEPHAKSNRNSRTRRIDAGG